MVADIDINRAAKELIERYGDSAISVARDRVEALAAKDQSELNLALRVLSALESMVEGKPPGS